MKQVPNLFTLLNLFFGCIAIVFIMQTNTGIVTLDDGGATEVVFPERMAFGALFIFFAAAVDFFDGFFARLLKASTDKGKQLDSLSDVVSFGVAPGMILFQLLRLGYAQNENGLDTSLLLLLPAFIFTGAVAWRLAKFNVSTNQSDSFIGVPSPAAGLVVASFPLIIHQYVKMDTASWLYNTTVPQLLINIWLLYFAIAVISYLMVCNRTFIAFKFKSYSFKDNSLKYSLLILSVLLLILLQWLAIPIIFLLYLVFSAFSKTPATVANTKEAGTLDVTV